MRYPMMLAALLCSISSYAVAGEPPHLIKPLMEWSGNDSKQPTQEFAICRSQEQWDANWKKHGGKQASCPRFDFSSQMMVVFFRGQTGEDAIVLSQALEETDRIELRFSPVCHQVGEPQDTNVPENDSPNESKKSAATVPTNYPSLFAFVLMPKSSKAISIQENTQSELGAPPIWRELQRFPAIVHVGTASKTGQQDTSTSAQSSESSVAKALHRAKGLILYLMLRPGMTTTQVDPIVRAFGGLHMTNFQVFANSLTPSVFWFDDEIHGLRMGYMENNDGVFRLNSIRLLPIEKGQ